MEDQGKRLLLAVAVAFGLMMLWSVLFPPEKPEPAPEGADEAAEVDGAGDDERAAEGERGPGDGAGEAVAPARDEVAPPPRGAEQHFDFEFPRFAARFSSYGGALVSWRLLGDQLLDRQTGAPHELIEIDTEGLRPLEIAFEDSTYEIPAGAEWRGEKLSDHEMRFVWESPEMRVIKDFRFRPEVFAVELTVDVEILGGERGKQTLSVVMSGYQDPEADVGGGMMGQVAREWKAACGIDGEAKTSSVGSLRKNGPKFRVGAIEWGGLLHSYFLKAMAPRAVEGRRLECVARQVEGQPGQMAVSLVFPRAELEPRAPIKETLVAYIGPKYLDELEHIESAVGYGGSLRDAVDLGFLAVIAGPLLWMLKWFYGFVGNWGLAIILLTVVVKALTLPWTHKSMKSMQAMSKLRPQLEKIKEKYKDDRQRQQVETMNLFKAHKVNPAAGCLPMLLQMPIWFALYRALTVAGVLYQAEFLWLTDLTLSDPYYVMPVLLTGMMFLQTRLTPTTATGTQQKIMMYGMPAMFGVFSLFFPAGLTLYIFTNTVLTALHHLYMHRARTAEAAAVVPAAKDAVLDVEADEAASSEPAAKPAASKPASSKASGAPRTSGRKSKGKGKGKKRR